MHHTHHFSLPKHGCKEALYNLFQLCAIDMPLCCLPVMLVQRSNEAVNAECRNSSFMWKVWSIDPNIHLMYDIQARQRKFRYTHSKLLQACCKNAWTRLDLVTALRKSRVHAAKPLCLLGCASVESSSTLWISVAQITRSEHFPNCPGKVWAWRCQICRGSEHLDQVSENLQKRWQQSQCLVLKKLVGIVWDCGVRDLDEWSRTKRFLHQRWQ